jgi:PAS domain S-box-containing protein
MQPGDSDRSSRPFSHYLIASMVALTLVVAIGITIVDYQRAETDLQQNLLVMQNNTEEELSQSAQLVDAGYQLFDETLNKQMLDEFAILTEEYERAGRDPSRMDLDAIRKRFDHSMDIYIINDSMVIEYSTYAPDLGLDFKQFPYTYDYFKKIISTDGFYPDRVVKEVNTGLIRKYAYMPSPDHRNIFELGLSSQEFRDERLGKLDFTTPMEHITSRNPYLADIRLFDTTGHLARNNSYKPDPVVKNALSQVIRERRTIERIDPKTGMRVQYLFINLTDSNYASDMSWIVELTYDTSLIQDQLNSLLLFHASVAAIALLLSCFLAIIVSGFLTRPITQIVTDLEVIEQGDLGHRITPGGAEEFTRIEQGINSMVATIWGTIEQLKERELELKMNKEQYQAVIQSQSELITRFLPDGTIIFVNDAFYRFFGKSAEELVGLPFRPVTPDEDYALIRAQFSRFTPDRPSATIEHRIIMPWQEIRWLQWSILAIYSGDGVILEYQAVGRDITEKKRMEEELKESEKKFKELTVLLPQVVFETDIHGRIVYANQFAFDFFGYSDEEFNKGIYVHQIVNPQDRELITENFMRSLSGEKMYGSEYEVFRKDGTSIQAIVYSVPIIRDGNAIGLRGVLVDITRLKKIEAEITRLNTELEQRITERTRELKAANQELESFSYSVSHDLRAPLRAIDGFSYILLARTDLPDDVRTQMLKVRQNVMQMDNLINALLNFSRMSRQQLQKEDIRPENLVRDVFEELGQEQEGRTIRITIGSLPPCRGDPSLVRQVFFNLISNALKFTRKRDTAEIEIGSFRLGNQTVYTVRDNGIGFDMQYADKIFTVFQRLHNSQEYEGTGIGLAIVRRIIDRHGGRIWVESAVDQGTTFFFTLEGS